MNTHVDEFLTGALWGALAGDALGVPVEFRSRAELRNNPVVHMRAFGTHRQPAGTWSDDSSLLLCTVDSLASLDGFDSADIAERFVQWNRKGYWTPHGNVFDIGVATSEAISRLERGVAPENAGGTDEYSNGNGSLMRILPIALWFRNSTAEELISYAERASALTHGHPRSRMACALYCLFVRALLEGAAPAEAWPRVMEYFLKHYAHSPFAGERQHFHLLESRTLAELAEHHIESSGYVIHTLTASVWCLLTSGSFEEAVLKAVNLGGDTDTTGCVTGGLAGAHFGLASIPAEWKRALARHDDLETLFARFVKNVPVNTPQKS